MCCLPQAAPAPPSTRDEGPSRKKPRMEQEANSRPRPGSRRPSHQIATEAHDADAPPETATVEQQQQQQQQQQTMTEQGIERPAAAEPDAAQKPEVPPEDVPKPAQAEGPKIKDEPTKTTAAPQESKPPPPVRKASKDRPEQAAPAPQNARPAGPRQEDKAQDSFANRSRNGITRFWYGEQQQQQQISTGNSISTDDAQRLAYLERRVKQLENRPTIDQYNSVMTRYNAQIKGLTNAQIRAERLAEDKQSLLITNRNLQHELLEEQEQVKILQETIQQQQRAVAKVQSNSTNLLAQDVAAKMPDDKARRALRSLFDGDILGWCMDNKTECISDPRATKLLEEAGILADTQSIPPAQRLDMAGSTASAVLLEAALARDLCDSFLTDPFFLNPSLLPFDPKDFRNLPDNPVVAWRVHTSELLETVFPPTAELFDKRAHAFATRYAYLLEPLGEGAMAELADLYERFCRIALQLWKRKALISVTGLGEEEGLRYFMSGDGDVEAHASVQHEPGSTRLDGRPIHVLVRPRIVAEPILNSGRSGSRVVWSNAVVWVSNQGGGTS